MSTFGIQETGVIYLQCTGVYIVANSCTVKKEKTERKKERKNMLTFYKETFGR